MSFTRKEKIDLERDFIIKIVKYVLIALFGLLIVLGSWFTVSAGGVGVTFNRITGHTQSWQKGFYFKIPPYLMDGGKTMMMVNPKE
jgi:regulator of protease activity HflC (stomatin/prohibitin superfamily)